MKQETQSKMKYGSLGFVIGAAIAMIIGFAWGGWTTSGKTKTMTEEAVLASKAAICVAQFVKDPNYKENLKEFGKLDSYGMKNTSDYVQKNGWDKMPGEEKAGLAVADACAIGIEAFIKK